MIVCMHYVVFNYLALSKKILTFMKMIQKIKLSSFTSTLLIFSFSTPFFQVAQAHRDLESNKSYELPYDLLRNEVQVFHLGDSLSNNLSLCSCLPLWL